MAKRKADADNGLRIANTPSEAGDEGGSAARAAQSGVDFDDTAEPRESAAEADGRDRRKVSPPGTTQRVSPAEMDEEIARMRIEKGPLAIAKGTERGYGPAESGEAGDETPDAAQHDPTSDTDPPTGFVGRIYEE